MYFKDLLSSNEHLIQIEVGCSKKKNQIEVERKNCISKILYIHVGDFHECKK
jgi:hypothetical protein